MKDELKIKGEVSILVTDKDGKVKEERKINNLITNSGLAHITSRLLGTSQDSMGYIGLGTGTNAAGASDTTISTPLGSREAVDSASANVGVLTLTATFEANDVVGAITEAGIFNASSGGDMLARTTFAAVNTSATDTLAITWVVTISVS